MRHFDQLDYNGSGRLSADDFAAIAQREAESGMIDAREKLRKLARAAGIQPAPSRPPPIVAYRSLLNEGDYLGATRELELDEESMQLADDQIADADLVPIISHDLP